MSENQEKNINAIEPEHVSIDDAKKMSGPDLETLENNKADNKTTPDNKTIAELNAKISELNDKYLRVAAELENTRRRATLDIESVSRNRAMGVAEKILPVMDAVTAALKHNPEDTGIQSMERAIQSAFAQIGIVKIDSIGEMLNPQFHNAIQMVDKPTPETKTNTIVDEMQTGYMFGDTVLRTAMVIVSK